MPDEIMLGEVRTGLLNHSRAVSTGTTADLLTLIIGAQVRHSERPTAFAMSPPVLSGIDCALATMSGAKPRGIGTVISRAVVTGGHVLQGSAFARVTRGGSARRLPWSHYLSRGGVIEVIDKVEPRELTGGFMSRKPLPEALDLGAISGRVVDSIQYSTALDHVPPFRSSRTSMRWAMAPPTTTSAAPPALAFTIHSSTARSIVIPYVEVEIEAVAALCEDIALHDWLLTTLLTLIGRSRPGSGSRATVLALLRPAVDYLLHLWMPASRVDHRLAQVWDAIERHPGLSRQWRTSVDRIRDQLALATIAALGRATE